MSLIPSLCNNPRLPQNLRDISGDIWRNVPKPERRPVELPRGEWRGEFHESGRCIVLIDRDKPALLAWNGQLDAESGRLGEALEREKVFELSIAAGKDFTIANVPAPGETLFVSADNSSLWIELLFVCFEYELRDGPVHEITALEDMGLTFTGNYANEADYWLRCNVLQAVEKDDGATILARIESVIWNEPLDREPPDALAVANRQAREVRRIPTSDPQARDVSWLELERKLTDSDWEVRWSTICGGQHILTPEQIDRAQRDKKRMVRIAIAKRFDLGLDSVQIEVGLTDQSVDVRETYAYRGGYTLTPEQIERGLTDESGLVRLRIATRQDVVGRLTAMQIERGLADDCEEVRSTFAELVQHRRKRAV
jgi:hypothetical protein